MHFRWKNKDSHGYKLKTMNRTDRHWNKLSVHTKKISLEEKVGTILGDSGTPYLQWEPLSEK